MTRIAFLFIAEAYQVYHGYPVALALAEREGISVEIFYNDVDCPRHFARLATAFGLRQPPAERLQRRAWTRFVQSLRVFGLAKNSTMADNLACLNDFDAIIAVEETVSWLASRRHGDRPALIYIPHGSGDRAIAVQPSIASFDLVLPTGAKDAQRFVDLGLVRPGGFTTTGYIKLEVVEQLSQNLAPLFAGSRPVVLYNPHKARGLSSWATFIEPMLAQFAQQDRWSLVIAPHIKMFRRSSARTRARWEGRSDANTIVDVSSDRLLDNTYTAAADIYVGDVSSQVYEFLAVPRPCVFLNPRRIEWRGNPDFRFWTLGEVIEDPAELMPAIARAQDRHAEFLPLQRQLVAETLGPIAGATQTAADAIYRFVRDGWIDP